MASQKLSDQANGAVADEVLLKIAKEIAVKFIEVGRMTPATFGKSFEDIYLSVKKTVKKGRQF